MIDFSDTLLEKVKEDMQCLVKKDEFANDKIIKRLQSLYEDISYIKIELLEARKLGKIHKAWENDYRIFFEIIEDETEKIIVHFIGHKTDAYKQWI